MAVAYNNQKIPTDGLVFYYDMFNTQKSWKGEPTDNLFRRDSFLVGGTSPYNTQTTGTTEGGFLDPFGGNKAVKYTSVGTLLRYGAINGTNPDMPSGNTYTFSFYAKLVPGASVLTSASADIVDRGTYNFTSQLSNDWQRFSFSALHDNNANYAFVDVNINSGGEILLSHPQIEQKSYATPYVFGERTNTQAILDLTKKHTFTANNLSYSSNNIFAFDGTTSNLTTPHNATTMDFALGQTICIWMLPGVGSSSARRNPYNQAYGGPGTITHETSRRLTYFFGTHGGNSTPYASLLSTFTVEPEELAFVAITRDQATNSTRWYKNGIFSNSGTAGGYATTANGTSPIVIGNGYTNEFIGDLYSTAVYNRQLSDDEVRQVFEISRHRYGI